MVDVQLHLGDCLEILPTLEVGSVDAVITDPPYPHIKRDYGYWTEQEWWDMMIPVVTETRRILKPTGSAVFILQPNSEKVGKMRGWLWEFMAWVCREWNMIQDIWWWNLTAVPNKHANANIGLTRPSIKACVWAGNSGCYRNQDNILWEESERNVAIRAQRRATKRYKPYGGIMRDDRCCAAAEKRGGVTPYNLIPIGNCNSQSSAGASGHSAGTPLRLVNWWTRYICPPGGVVADWFMGSGTMGIAAVQNGCSFVGIEKMDKPGYFPTAQERVAEAQLQPRLEGMG